MTYTPEQLREEATQLERENCDVMKVDQRTQIALLREHAAALEEIERLAARVKDLEPDAERYRWLVAHRAIIVPAVGEEPLRGNTIGVAIDALDLMSRAERAESALSECRAKLEVDPRTKYDGIDCRDETIRMLEQKCERLIDVALHKFGVDLSAEFKEES